MKSPRPVSIRVGVIAAFLLVTSAPLLAQQRVQLESSDGHPVHAYRFSADGSDLSEDGMRDARVRARPLIIAFNQGGADARSEYGPIVPRLLDAGFDVLAVDVRAGGDRFGGRNLTVEVWGGEQPYCEAAADVEGALSYARDEHDGPIVLWGSSFSAALVLRAAADRDDIAAVLAFSPASGGPLADCRGEDVSARISAPVLVLRPAAEAERAAAQLERFREQGHEVFVADPGTHGSSMLVADRVDAPVESTWRRVLDFISGALDR